jgi:hypothetical protein
MMEMIQPETNTMILAEKTALVLIDLQQGICHPSRQSAPYDSAEVVRNASRLAQTFAEDICRRRRICGACPRIYVGWQGYAQA